MKVLLLTQVLPYPPDSGPKIKTWNVLKCLAREHEVTLASFVRGDQSGAVSRLLSICQDVLTVPMRRGWLRDGWGLGRSLISERPWVIVRDDRAAMRSLVDHLARSRSFDVVHADQVNMAQYALRVPGCRRLLDAHNALWLLYTRLAATTSHTAGRWLFRRDARLLQRYEGEMCSRFNLVLAVTDVDRQALRQAVQASRAGGAGDIRVIPIVVDTDELPFRRRTPSSNRILHMGTMFWPPNVDGIRWLLDAVLPLIRRQCPDVGLDILGANPPPDLVARGSNCGDIRILGYVADPGPFLTTAGVFVVPLLAGGGMRVKILTAMAQGLPVVTTRVGCEGIDLVPGRHALVADSPEDFAAAMLRVLAQPRLAEDLSLQGRRFVEQRYSLPQLAGELREAYTALVGTRA